MPRKVAKTHRVEFSNIYLLLCLYYLNAVASETVVYVALMVEEITTELVELELTPTMDGC